MADSRFAMVGIRPAEPAPSPQGSGGRKGRPWAAVLLGIIVAGCLFCGMFTGRDPAYLDLYHSAAAPCRDFWFGTDTLGRDIFSMIWYGGRTALLIGFLAAALSTVIGIATGTASALAPRWLDALVMRLAEILLSVPELLLAVLLQAAWGQATAVGIAVAIGLTGWMSIAKVVRAEVRQLRGSAYVEASRCMGGGFLHILRRHLLPNLLPSILFMVVMNFRSAVIAESTLSFMGIGLPVETVSWGSMLSLADNAILSGCWWMLLIPGAFLIATLLCVTAIGESLRRDGQRRPSNL